MHYFKMKKKQKATPHPSAPGPPTAFFDKSNTAIRVADSAQQRHSRDVAACFPCDVISMLTYCPPTCSGACSAATVR